MEFASFPQQSNKADWTAAYELRDEDTDELIDLTGWTATISLERGDRRTCTPALTGSTTDGTVTNPSTGYLLWTFRASRLTDLFGQYRVGLILTNGTDTIQSFIGTLPLIEGL